MTRVASCRDSQLDVMWVSRAGHALCFGRSFRILKHAHMAGFMHQIGKMVPVALSTQRWLALN